jgi:hypothetical protein
LDALAHTFLFHAAITWLVFALTGTRGLQYSCTLLSGFLAVTPICSPWAVILAPLVLRLGAAALADPQVRGAAPPSRHAPPPRPTDTPN